MQLHLQFLLGYAISQAISRSTCNRMAITTSGMQLKKNLRHLPSWQNDLTSIKYTFVVLVLKMRV